MFLKIATIAAILGLTLNLFLWLIQQVVFTAGFYGPYGTGYLWFARLMSLAQMLSLHIPLLLFFVAFLLSLRTKTD